jgi:hypothetical protein
MQFYIYNAIAAMLAGDDTLDKRDKRKILAVCRQPRRFFEPIERVLPRIMTLAEVTKTLRVSRATVWRMVKTGKLRQLDYTTKARFLLEDVEKLIGYRGSVDANQPTEEQA